MSDSPWFPAIVNNHRKEKYYNLQQTRSCFIQLNQEIIEYTMISRILHEILLYNKLPYKKNADASNYVINARNY